MLRDELTGTWIDSAPANRWAVVLDRDAEWVAIRQGHSAVMTRGCKDPAIADADDAEAVCEIVRDWHASHRMDATADRQRVAACRASAEDLRRDDVSCDIAIERRIAQFRADGSDLSKSDIAAGVTTYEVATVRSEIFGD
jgi:hypothetical protein